MATSIGVKLGLDGEAEFRKGLNDIVSTTKSLDKQLSALESSFDSEKKSMSENQKQTELLEKKKAALEKQIDETNKALEYAKDNYEENSKQVSSWEGSLADAEKQLNEVNKQIEENNEYAEESQSALGQLTDEIETQTAQLEELRDAYVNAVLESGEESEEAQNLAAQMTELNSAIADNKEKLDAANESADQFTGSLNEMSAEEEDLGAEAQNAASAMINDLVGGVTNAFAQGGIVGGIIAIISAIVEMIAKVEEASIQYQENLADMEIATGVAGEDLVKLRDQARDAWAAIANKDLSEGDFDAAYSALYTRLGLTQDQIESESEALNNGSTAMAEYAEITGTDATEAVNTFVDILKQWGMWTDDYDENIANMTLLADKFSEAQSDSDISLQTLGNTLANQAAAYQSLGLSIDDTIGTLVAYEDAGGDAQTMASSMQRALNNLTGEVDDAPAAWQTLINIMSTASSYEDACQQASDQLGLTLSDVFGTRTAQQMYNTFSNGGVASDSFSQKISNADGLMQKYFDDTRTDTDVANQKWKEFAKYTEQAGKQTSDVWKDVASSAKTSSTQASDALSESIKTARQTALNNPIKMSVEVPNVIVSTTKTGVSAYQAGTLRFARGYDEAISLNSPTIFGASGGNFLMGGDRAGTEIVVGEDHLLDMMSGVLNGSNGNGSSLGAVVALLQEYLPECANSSIYLDGDALVGSTAGKMNTALGRLATRQNRGM